MNEQQLYDELKPAVWVTLEIQKDGSIGMGTGFCVDPKGLIMTCSHCVTKDNFLAATQNDKSLEPAVLLHRNESWDTAVFCLEEALSQSSTNNYPYISFAADSTFVPGQDLYSISHQNRFMYSFSSGKASYGCMKAVNEFDASSSSSRRTRSLSTTSDYRTVKEVRDDDVLHQGLPLIEIMNVHVSGGGSGGPVLLPTKEVVGMNTFGGVSKSYAVHVSALRIAFMEANKEFEKRVSSLSAKLDEQEHQKNTEEVTKADKSKEI